MKARAIFLFTVFCSLYAAAISGEVVEYSFNATVEYESHYTNAYVYGGYKSVVAIENPNSRQPVLRKLDVFESQMTNAGLGSRTMTIADVTSFRRAAFSNSQFILKVRSTEFVMDISKNTVRFKRDITSPFPEKFPMTVKSTPARNFQQESSSQVWVLDANYPVTLGQLSEAR